MNKVQKNFTYSDFSGGLNDLVVPSGIADNELTDVYNFHYTTTKGLKKRNGYSKWDTSAFSANPIRGLYEFNPSGASTVKSILAVCNGYVYGDRNLTGTFGSALNGVQFDTNANWDFVTLNNICIFVNGVDAPQKITDSGSLVNAVLGGTPTMSDAAYVVIFNNYCIMAGSNTNPSRIVWSGLNNPETWAAGDYIDINLNDNDRITGLTVLAGYLYVFKRRYIYRVAFTGNSDTPFVVTGNPAIKGIGTISNRCISSYADTIYFFSGDAVFSFNGTTVTKISDKIETTIGGLSDFYNKDACSGIMRKHDQYWLAVTTSGQTEHDLVLIYDYRNKAWTRYTGIYPNVLAEIVDNNNISWLFSGESRSTGGGFVYKQDDTTADSGAAINATAATKWFDHGLPESIKKYKGLYIFATTAASSYNLVTNVKFDFDDGDGTQYTFDLAGAGTPLGTFMLGTSILGQASVQRYFTWLELRKGRWIQIKFTQNGASEPLTIYGYSLHPIYKAFKG